MEIGLSLGSNMGDRLRNLQMARDAIVRIKGADLLAQSPVYETEPVEVSPEHAAKRFLNTVLIVETELDPKVLFFMLRSIETRMGRRRTVDRNAPRPLDVDMIYAGHSRVKAGVLILPHPRWHERRFVVQPLADVRPELVLPGEPRSAEQVLRSLPKKPEVRLLSHQW